MCALANEGINVCALANKGRHLCALNNEGIDSCTLANDMQLVHFSMACKWYLLAWHVMSIIA